MVLGIVLLFFISTRKYKDEATARHPSLRSILESVFAPMLEIRMLLIIPLFAYSGLHQAFVWYAEWHAILILSETAVFLLTIYFCIVFLVSLFSILN